MAGFFHRKADPISDRARQLEAEIRKLEKEIDKLSSRAGGPPDAPRLRSTVRPHSGASAASSSNDPVFEEVDLKGVTRGVDMQDTPAHYNELGVRKYDLAAAIKRWTSRLRGGQGSNPKLINYLASGSVHGLRPLRYEKRVARYRFIAAVAFLLLVLYGLCAALLKL